MKSKSESNIDNLNYDVLKEIYENKEMLNYKQLCERLGINVLTGNSKVKQLKELSGILKYERKGQKYLITELCDKEIVDMFNKRSIYIPYIQLILTDIFENLKKEELYFTYKEILYELGMINKNYKVLTGNNSYYNCQVVANENGFSPNHLYKYISKSYNEILKPIVKSALNSMKNSKSIDCVTGYGLYKKTKVGSDYVYQTKFTNINEDLGRMLFKIEGETMDDLGIKNSNELYGKKSHLQKEYYKLCDEKLSKYKIEYDGFYRSNFIILNKKRLANNIPELKKELNQLIQKRISGTIINTLDFLNGYEMKEFLKATIEIDGKNDYDFYNDLKYISENYQ